MSDNFRQKPPERHKTTRFHGIPRPSKKWFFATLALSLLIHLASYINVDYYGRKNSQRLKPNIGKSSVKVRYVDKKAKEKKKKPSQAAETKKPQRILESKLEPTEKPKEADFLGAQDHIAKKKTKTRQPSQLNDADPGLSGQAKETKAQQNRQQAAREGRKQAEQKLGKADKAGAKSEKIKKLLFGDGPAIAEKKSNYQKLLPSRQEMRSQRQAGYQDYVDDEAAIGDRVDFNTTSYRYIGYFTQLRKAFAQTWVYPSAAVRRGLQGKVQVEFTIARDGSLDRVKVLQTSGHSILDGAVVEAIELSSPFSPLPGTHTKDKLTVVANFVYSLQGYAF